MYVQGTMVSKRIRLGSLEEGLKTLRYLRCHFSEAFLQHKGPDALKQFKKLWAQYQPVSPRTAWLQWGRPAAEQPVPAEAACS